MASSKHELCGVLPVFQTPYHPDETIDYDTLEIAWLHDCGAHGIVMALDVCALQPSALASSKIDYAAESAEFFAGESRRGAIPSAIVATNTQLPPDFQREKQFFHGPQCRDG